jgi:quercetin dioxygenase-like cupin family protein
VAEPNIVTLIQPPVEGALPFSKDVLYGNDNHDFNLVKVAPGFFIDPHPYTAGGAFMLVLEGGMELKVDGQSYNLSAGQMAIIPKGAARGFKAGPAGMTMLAAHLRD